jgi:hypothetical protein
MALGGFGKDADNFWDPRGPERCIIAVVKSPTGGETKVTLSCGHVVNRVNHFSYRIGDTSHCLPCHDVRRLA